MKKKNPILTAGFVLLGLVVITALFFLFRYSNQPKVKRVRPTMLVEGKNDIVIIYGKNFPDPDRISVNFGGIPGVINLASKNQLTVRADIEKMKVGKHTDTFATNMSVRVDNKNIKLTTIHVALDKTIVVNDYSPKKFWKGSTVTFSGKNLNNSAKLKVVFSVPGDVKQATIKATADKTFSVTVPSLAIVTTNIPKPVTLTVYGDNNIVYQGHGGIVTKPPIIILPDLPIINPNN